MSPDLIYINFNIGEVNDLTDELYESMSDCDKEKVKEVCEVLIKKLRDIRNDHLD